MDVGEVKFVKTVTLGKAELKALEYSKMRKSLLLGLMIGALSFIMAHAFSQMDIMSTWTIKLLVWMGVFVILFPLIMYFISVPMSLKVNSKLLIPTLFTFGDDAFSESNDMATSLVSYQMIERVLVRKNIVLIFINASNAYLIPLTPFDTGDASEFCAFLEQKTGKVVKRV